VVKLVYLKMALHDQQAIADAEGRSLSREDLSQAVINGALLRLRPITMTIATIIAGLLPIMLGSGTGSEVMQRIAAPMAGGIVSATVLTLAVIPATFLVWQEHRLKQQAP
jgi:Cu(I)/Ag(I) efflux system membrane protein CusA/SilA